MSSIILVIFHATLLGKSLHILELWRTRRPSTQLAATYVERTRSDARCRLQALRVIGFDLQIGKQQRLSAGFMAAAIGFDSHKHRINLR